MTWITIPLAIGSFATENNGVMQMSGSSYEMLSPLPNPFSADKITQIHLDSNGKIWGFSQGGLLSLNSVGTGWTMEQAGGTSQWPFGIVKEVFEINGIIYAAIGVMISKQKMALD